MTWNYTNYSKVDPEVAKYFPFKSPRQFQLETISEIKGAIDKGYKYIVLEAGTGTGKSAIAAALSKMFDSSYILTITKQLQDQYQNDFSFSLVKGRANFECRKYREDGIRQSCDFGRCIVEGHSCKYSLKHHAGDEITKENTCPYYYQKFKALNSQVAISNYHYMFLELNYVEDFKKRDLMVCDEAHNIESMIMNQLSLEFARRDLKEHLKVNLSKDKVQELSEGDYTDWIGFITKIQNKYEKELSRIENLNTPEVAEKIIFFKNQINDCRRFLTQIELDPKMWIFDYDRYHQIAQFRPLKIDNYAKNTLFRHGEVCLFMSATILDYELFARWLGISPSEIYAIRRKSPFDIKRNPIKTCSGFNMSRANLNDTAPKTISTIENILRRHENEKGIIHTVSGQCRDFLISNISSDRFIYHDANNRSEIIDEFKNSEKPLVLVSPSVSEGVDLPGDECRFQIIYKIPYPDLGDKQIDFRSAMEPKWYDYKTSLALVQTHGRGMRFDDDYCMTYVIDSRFTDYVSNNRFIPDTFIEAIEGFEKKKKLDIHLFDESDEFTKNVKIKRRLIVEGEKYFDGADFEKAIDFYRALIGNDLFQNDYYAYLKLAKSYDNAQMYEDELNTILEFLKSGIYASDEVLDEFKNHLKRLDAMGYFDYEANISSLENEFYTKSNRNKNMADVPVLRAEKLIWQYGD